MALGVPGSLRSRIFSTFGTTSVVGRQPNAPADFTPGENPGTHFQRLSRPQGTCFFLEGTTEKIPSETTVQLIAQRLNCYATPGPHMYIYIYIYIYEYDILDFRMKAPTFCLRSDIFVTKFSQILGILNNNFQPTLFQKYSRIEVYNALAVHISYVEAKFWTLNP